MTIFDYIEGYAFTRPDDVAIKSNTREITYADLYKYANDYRNTLINNKCVSGSTVLLKLNKQPDWIIIFLGLLLAECWVIPVSENISEYELDKIMKITKSNVIVDEMINYSKLESAGNKIEYTKPYGEACGIYHMTSGTTGIPKLCIRTLNSITNEGISYKNTFQINAQDKVLNVPPLYHSYALGAAGIAALVSGACLYVLDRFVPREVLRVVEVEKITIIILVPVMARLICNTYLSREINSSSLRIVLVGAGAITNEVYAKFFERFGIALFSNYGSTETGGFISRKEPQPRDSVGKPMDGVKIKILDENSKKVPIGNEGELWVWCKGMFNGYLNSSESVIDSEGYFPMGDIVVQDEQGYIYIKGRKKSIINVGGKKVNPYEIEEALAGLPGIKECVVIGIKKVSGEETVKAVVVSDELDEAAVRSYCFSKLSEYKIPTIIEFVDKLPRNELGKIRRDILVKG